MGRVGGTTEGNARFALLAKHCWTSKDYAVWKFYLREWSKLLSCNYLVCKYEFS